MNRTQLRRACLSVSVLKCRIGLSQVSTELFSGKPKTGEPQSHGDWFLAAIPAPSQVVPDGINTDPTVEDRIMLDGGLCPRAPRIFRLSAIANVTFIHGRRGELSRPFWSGPWSALELRPRGALSSANVSNSVAENHRQKGLGHHDASKRHLRFGNIFS